MKRKFVFILVFFAVLLSLGLKINNNFIHIDDTNGYILDSSGDDSCDFDSRKLWNSSGDIVIDWESGTFSPSVETTTSYITPAAISANTDNWNPSGLSTTRIIRASSTGNYELRGLVAQSAHIITLVNVGSNDIKIMDEATTSTTTNRFALQNDLTLQDNEAITVWYDPVSTRWRGIGGLL